MHKKIYFSFFIIFLIFLLSIPIIFHKQFFRMEEKVDDWKQLVTLRLNKIQETDLHDKIVILSIDDMTPFELSQYPSLNLKRWPLGRDVWSEIIDFVEAGSPKTLSIAVPFQNYEEITLSANSSDLMLANTLKKYNNIVLGTVLSTPENISKDSIMTDISDRIDNPYRPMRKSLDVNIVKKDFPASVNYYSYLQIPYIFTDNSLIGFLNIPEDADKVVRYSQPISKVITGATSYYMPSFAFATSLKYIGYEGEINYRNKRLLFDKYSIPLNFSAQHLITWRGTSRAYEFIPLSKIIIGMKSGGKSFVFNNITYPKEYFKDKIVIIAPTQTNLDTHKTSIEDGITSAEIYANMVESYINDAKLGTSHRVRFIKNMPLWADIMLGLICAGLLVLNTLLFRTSLLSFFNSLMFVIMFLACDMFIFSCFKIRVNVSVLYPVYLMFAGLVAAYFYVIFMENSKKKEIVKIFGKFVSDSILEKLLKKSDGYELKAEKKEITAMCCDVTNFAEISENYTPEEALEKLNKIFEKVMQKVFKYNGTFDKIHGNALIAYWGEPVSTGNDALNAVKSAVEILEVIAEENEKPFGDDIKPDVRISINTGEALIGCIEAGKKSDYTAVGEAINAALKMQEICFQFNKKLLVSDKTYSQTEGFIQADFSGNIKLKGKEEQIAIFAPILSKNDD